MKNPELVMVKLRGIVYRSFSR